MNHTAQCHTSDAVITDICGTFPPHLTPPHSGVCNPAPTQALGASVSSGRWKEGHCWSSKSGTKDHQGLLGWHNRACREHHRKWLTACLWWKPASFYPLWQATKFQCVPNTKVQLHSMAWTKRAVLQRKQSLVSRYCNCIIHRVVRHKFWANPFLPTGYPHNIHTS